MEFFRSKQARELHEDLGKSISKYGNQVGCMNAPDEWFTLGKDVNIKNAYNNLEMVKKICSECPVKNLCLEYALEQQEEFGIFGGLTPGERRRLRRK
jgi:WhiB family redox-sensing transcriptional regulator